MRLAPIAALACAAFLALAGPASANTFTVTKTADTNDGTCDSDCSLREALQAADINGVDDTITVPAGDYLLSSLLGELTVDSNVNIVGANARTTIIDAGGHSRVLDILNGTVGISHVTITGGSGTGGSGNDGQGGGIFNDGILTLDSSAVEGNVAPNGGFFGGQGGGIFNNDDLTVTNTSVSNNIADGTGASGSGGQGGGVFANDVVRLKNVTLSGNQAKPGTGKDGQGGAFFVNENSTLTNVTIAGNTGSGNPADATGGVYINGGLTVVNSIIAGNTDNGTENDCVFDTFGSVTDSGHNLDGANDCGFTGPGDLLNTNPLLGPLADNGGDSDTRALQTGSPAIDAGDSSACPATDQRGVARPQLAGCDIGAFELTPPPPPSPVPAPAPSDTTKPKIVVRGLGHACVAKKLKIRVTVSDASGIKRTRVTFDGKRIRIRSKTKFTLTINFRRLKPGRHVLRIVATDNASNTAVKRRIVRRCGKR